MDRSQTYGHEGEGTYSVEPDYDRYFESRIENLHLEQFKFPNVTSIKDVVELFEDSSFGWFLLSLLCAIAWIVYITFYSSRISGLVFGKIANRFIRDGDISIGSISLSVLAGKVMFRDVSFSTEDFTLKVQDGWVIFRWWRVYVPKDISEDMSHSDTRLSILLNGFEYHLYNRSELYSRLEKLFDLDPNIIPFASFKNAEKPEPTSSHPKPPSAVGYSWRDLIPVIKLELNCGRLVFGNMLTPCTLALVVEEAHLIYTTKPADSKLDHFMHIIKCRGENFKVLLTPSPKYTGLKDDPPRLMGEGFAVLASNKVEIYYYMDEPGITPTGFQALQLENGDIMEANPPIWGIDIKCGKGTDFSYGPWADRQRELLHKLFFPQDYQSLKPSSPPKPGDKRQVQSLDIRLSTLTEATIDILFTKDEETNAVHMNIGAGSYLEVTMPWIVHTDGYATKITGQLLHLEASTSLQFRDLYESETLQYSITCNYPILWNDHQDWIIKLTGCKASGYLIYAHKWFFQALINDWASRNLPDILHFIPYTWRISFALKEFELITPTNEYNWIDCSSQYNENALLGACGELFELSFDLPFHEFFPESILFKFWIQVECGDLNFYIPEDSTAHIPLQSIIRSCKSRNRDGSIRPNLLPLDQPTKGSKVKKWRHICQFSRNWIECWSVPICAVSVAFTYHPMPPTGPPPQADVTTPEKEEILLLPIRIPGEKETPKPTPEHAFIICDFDPITLPPDLVHVELEVGPSVLQLYGSLLKLIINLKENVFGDYQDFINMEKIKSGIITGTYKSNCTGQQSNVTLQNLSNIDPREYRPLEVTVSATLHDIRAHLLKNCTESDSPCPTISIERFGFEMQKKYDETILQVLLSPAMLFVSDDIDRSESGDRHLNEGLLTLSGLQVRGHAMFSNEGRTLEQETLEYAWLIEVQLGKLSGRLTTPHVETLVAGCETFLLLALDMENSLRSPHTFFSCHHGYNQFECPVTNEHLKLYRDKGSGDGVEPCLMQTENVCPTSEDIKYKMLRVSVDAIDLYVVEAGSVLNLWISPIRCGLCNLHGTLMKEGFTLLIPHLQVRHFISVNPSFTKRFQFSDLNIQSSSETMTASWTSKIDVNSSVPQSPASTATHSFSYLWLEAGAIVLGPLCIEVAEKGNPKALAMQNLFLMKHDNKTRRLWLLWSNESKPKTPENQSMLNAGETNCACTGGTMFFGRNSGGQRFFWPSKKDWADGVNVACFRVNRANEDPGFGQSILKKSALVFDTPPYTTQGFPLLELHSEWNRNTHPKGEAKTPFIFKSSLLADLSHTSSSLPSNKSERLSNVGSTLQSSKGRRLSNPNAPPLRRQSRILENASPQLEHESKVESEGPTPEGTRGRNQEIEKTTSFSSDSKTVNDCFQSIDGLNEITTFEDASTLGRRSSKTVTEEAPTEDMIGTKQPWNASFTSLDSLSDVSFISALSVQEECMVNLQQHLKKPIADSSLLMPCYMSHLTQLKCDNWHINAPTIVTDSASFVQSHDGKLTYAGSKFSPHFEPLVDGFTTLAMVNRNSLPSSQSLNTPSLSRCWDSFSIPPVPPSAQEKEPESTAEDHYRSLYCCDLQLESNLTAECITAIIRTKKDINIMLSPMLLEAIEKLVEALTPSLTSIHPITMINHLHNQCISRVASANRLKKEKSMLLMRIQSSKRATAVRQEESSPLHSNLFEETTLTTIQGSVVLPKINVTVLQASVVEEVISFSALDNIRDLMCVSLLAIAIEQTTFNFIVREQTKKSVQVLYRPSILPKMQKKRKSKVSASDSMLAEPVFIENSEKQSELISTSIEISRMHAQLRRLKNDSSILREAVITAIPNQHSKVLFKFSKIPYGLQEVRSTRDGVLDSGSSTIKESFTFSSISSSVIDDGAAGVAEKIDGLHGEKCPDEKLGFIMCECGLEGISLKGVKNAELGQKQDDKEETSVTVCNERSSSNIPNTSSATNLASDDETVKDPQNNKEDIPTVADESTLPSQSQFSISMEQTDKKKQPKDKKQGPPNVSCVVQFDVMWYNFAAPPQTPITRKIDYTRVDWNLVSTASTAISAWLNPIDRLSLAIVSLLKGHSRRSAGLLASLMAEALEIQSIHQPMKSKYSKLTALAKTLQDDPSCQLCVILRRFIARTNIVEIEANVVEPVLPQLSTLRQGVIVLSRQWKNVLYTPLLLEHNLKSKKSKNFTVTFTLPQTDEESPVSDGEMSVEETTDERATLLDTEPGTVSLQSMRFNKRSRESNASSFSEIFAANGHKSLPTQHLSSTRASDVYPMSPSNPGVSSIFSPESTDKIKRFNRLGSFGSIITGNWSTSSEDDAKAESGISTPGTKLLNNSSIIRNVNEWNINNDNQVYAINDFMSEHGHEESLLLGAHSKFPQHPSLMLLDAHVIFKPLLTSMGLMPQQIIGYNFDNWGSHMSTRVSIEALKIDIVESEGKGVGQGSLRGRKTGTLNISHETPAFLCEKISLDGDFQKSTDMSRDTISKRSVIYFSRNYWKKQVKSSLVFCLNIEYISQQVNMPLLRLLHQITTMYQNVRETQLELRERRPSEATKSNLAQKNSSSSGSDIHEPARVISESREIVKPKLRPDVPSTSAQASANDTTNTASTLKGATASRTQSFAQRFKAANKSRGPKIIVNGTVKNSSASQTPTSVRGTDFPDDNKSPRTPQTPAVSNTGNLSHHSCWKTIYYLLDLYATRPETKTVFNARPSALLGDTSDAIQQRNTRINAGRLFDGRDQLDDIEKGLGEGIQAAYVTSSMEKQKETGVEMPRLSIFGVAKIRRTRLLATLSGLKLEAEITNLQASSAFKKKLRPPSMELSLTGHVGQTMIVLLEGQAPSQQTVVKISLSRPDILYCYMSKRSRDKNCALLTVGPINIDIPQHPVVLHGMMTRSTKQLSSTLQEFRVNRTSSRISRGMTFDEVDFNAQTAHTNQYSAPNFPAENKEKPAETPFFQPLIVQFNILVESLSVTASLLPSLQAQYKMEAIKGCGITGNKANFKVNLPTHNLSFTTKLTVAEANLPSAASISLPEIDVAAEFVQDSKGPSDLGHNDGLVVRRGTYLSSTANIGAFEHCLTTDLLNHLVFVQKVFMKEVNEVVFKMSGGDKPVPLWDEESTSPFRNLLFTLAVKLKGIQITATTPTNTAMRLETGPLEFRVSNRDHVKSQTGGKFVAVNASSNHYQNEPDLIQSRVFLRASVDVNLSLGQLIRNMVFEEAESDYQQYAFFKTHIDLRNTFTEETNTIDDADKEVILIALTKPLIYVQPVAVDKAILVWLNYKNAYEYWNEQRSSLNTEVLAATHFQMAMDRVQQPTILTEQSSILFLQLTVEDMGISIPLNPSPHIWTGRIEENRGAVVVTLDSTSISACSSGSLVSTGKFTGLCFRFSEDIMVTMDDWKPNLTDPNVLNFCVVSEGTYEVCSRTNSQNQLQDNASAKWFLNVKWSMEGVDMHVDVNVGKQLSALGHTLTTLAAFEEEDENTSYQGNMLNTSQDLPDFGDERPGRSQSQEFVVMRRHKSQGAEATPGELKQKRNQLEKEMQERASFIEELQKTGASEDVIEDERKKLQELENVAFKDFRRDWIKKLRRQSSKATSIRDKFGLGPSKSPHLRSKSFIESSPVKDSPNPVMSPVEIAPSPSTESSPREGPSRSTSLRFNRSKQRVTFGETQRQYSVESASVTTPEDDDEEMEVWLDQNPNKQGDGLTPGSSMSHKALEPNVDLELDVKVFINSGKCVLHTKSKDEEQESRTRKRSERSGSGYDSLVHTGSPIGSRKSVKQNTSNSRFKSPPVSTFGQSEVTVFHIPGLDVKIHYDSHVLYEEKESHIFSPRLDTSNYSIGSGPPGFAVGRKGGTKKASLFAWMTLHSVPEETIISPHILDFLEQTLEPIPMPLNQKGLDDTSVNTEVASGAASTYYTSFPVDVVVYFHMQPSTFRFSCQPVSRVECMLRLPSLEIVFSSKRAEESDAFEKAPNARVPIPKSKLFTELGSKDLKESQSIVGGISVTGCLSDFSLYIFHPYGAAKKTTTDWSPLSDNERKDSVSMNVEFIKFNLSRSRKVNITTSNANVSDSKNFLQNNSEQQQAAIRFSIIVDVGSASFKNDMRRLTEILAFPKAWYRRSIVRRLFLGDLSTVPGYGEDSAVSHEEMSGTSTPAHKANKRRNSGPVGLTTAQKEKLRLNLEGEKELHRRGSKLDFFTGSRTSLKDTAKDQVGSSKWETLVLFTINFTKLNVQMNMGNVMGNVSWLIRDAKSDGRLAIGSSGHKNLYIGLAIDSSHIDAKGGIVAGTFEVVHFNSFLRAKEDTGTEPHHTVGFKMNGLELRLDFMGTSVLMGRVSDLEVTLRDEWQVHIPRRPRSDVQMATYRPAVVFIHGDLGWDQLQLLISKSTNIDLIKMHCKLDEFFSQQFKSSKWVFSTLNAQEATSMPPSKQPQQTEQTGPENGFGEELRSHHHWQNVLGKVSLMSLSSLVNPFPATGTVLGGTMDLHGNNISLACFHGVNFKAKSWALFSLKEPFISFSTEAQETHSQDSGGVHVVQNLNFSLGQNSQQTLTISNAPHESMAMVCRITRNVMFPPQFRTLNEWFHYAFAPGEIDDVQRFPSLERERERSDVPGRSVGRLHDPNHNREVIFALPSMELFFKTEHLQAVKTISIAEILDRPEVICSFITEFADHIFVTVDAEAFFFLHDLITSYIREKDKLVSAQLAAGRSQTGATLEDREAQMPSTSMMESEAGHLDKSTATSVITTVSTLEESAFQRDPRNYHCKTWQLEPTVRLLSWAGKSIEPYGVDYILHKLGFSHARITIPKWMQRGFMDPLDKILSLLVFRMIDLAKSDQQKQKHDENRAIK